MTYRVYRTKMGILINESNNDFLLNDAEWNSFINDDNLYVKIQRILPKATRIDYASQLIQAELLAPIDKQEVWAAGVTYFKSRDARIEESKDAGGGVFYNKVYDASRPELFFKASAQRTVGFGGKVNIRKDSDWNVPEPELTLFVTTNGLIVGYTIGNDMSSRSIEGENPLYLPQAKTYEKCAGLGPCISVMEEPISPETIISMEIKRKGHVAYSDHIAISNMKRRPEELVEYLYRECAFPFGCFLMTGTGIVPGIDFTLHSGDEISITIDHIGTLSNGVS